MKSSIIILSALLLTSGCSRPDTVIFSFPCGQSFKEQLHELVTLRDAGRISAEEYKVRRYRITNVMMH